MVVSANKVAYAPPERRARGLVVGAAVVLLGVALELAIVAGGLAVRKGHHIVTEAMTVTLSDGALATGPGAVTAGLIDLTVRNDGTQPHDLVVYQTDLAPDQLPLTDDGQIDGTNEALTKVFDSGGPVSPGDASSFVTGLVAGNYVLVDDLTGDYSGGMRSGLTVDEPATLAPVDHITLRDYSIASSVPSARAGLVDFEVTNNGPAPHEFLVFQTDLPGRKLPLAPDGRVDEEALPLVVDSGDDIKVGSSTTLSAALPPGHYLLVCNLTDHYKRGMYLPFDVK